MKPCATACLGARSEAWKYTPLRSLERRSFAPSPAEVAEVDPQRLADIPSPRLVFVNGRHAPSLSQLDGLPAGVTLQPLSAALASGEEAARFLGRRYERSEEVFARLNAALAEEGVLLRVAEGVQVESPLHLVFVAIAAAADQAWHPRHLIELRGDASLALLEHHLHAADNAHLGNTVAHVHLAAGARLSHAARAGRQPRLHRDVAH